MSKPDASTSNLRSDLLHDTALSALLLEERHYGFYLHGRSVHKHADANTANEPYQSIALCSTHRLRHNAGDATIHSTG